MTGPSPWPRLRCRVYRAAAWPMQCVGAVIFATTLATLTPRASGLNMERIDMSVLETNSSLMSPDQVHVTPAGPAKMFVVYATAHEEQSAESTMVRFGTSPDSLSHVQTGYSNVYSQLRCPARFLEAQLNMPGSSYNTPTFADLAYVDYWIDSGPEDSKIHPNDHNIFGCQNFHISESWWESPTLHTVLLDNLSPGQTYFYTCGPTSNKLHSFTMPPHPSAFDTLTVGVWGDVGQSNVSVINGNALIEMGAQLNLLPGGLSYADGLPWLWDTWTRLMQPLLSTIPTLYSVGAHEVAFGEEKFMPYTFRFPNPWEDSDSESPLWYSYDAGPVHFISLAGTFSPIGDGSAQNSWLREDLNKIDRSVTPWVVAMWATPWYSSNHEFYLEADPMRQSTELLLVQAGVNIVVSAQVRAYERTVPVVDFQEDQCGPVHLTVGSGGSYMGPSTQWVFPQPQWSAFRSSSYGVGQLEFLSESEARWTWTRTACVEKKEMPSMWLGGDDGQTSLYYVPVGDPSGACVTEGDKSEEADQPIDQVIIQQLPSTCLVEPETSTSRS